jgi:UDP-hydrolysing UDP-N-acetyl-D-glucosamine 2-epimerase
MKTTKKKITPKPKRKICFVITNFIHYSRNMLILAELKKRKDVELHVVVGGSALLSKYASKFAQVRSLLQADGIKNIHEVFFNLEGDSAVVKAKTAGLGIVEFANLFGEIRPDVVIVRGDRFEVLAAAAAAAYMNISVAHIEGGDVSGTLDESVRHAITKLSHIHFATNDPAKQRIIAMGENKKYVFNFGSPDIEVVHKIGKNGDSIDLNDTGSGAPFDVDKEFIVVLYHPVTTEYAKLPEQTKKVLKAIYELGVPTIWFWPNVDIGAEEISHELRIFNNEVKDHKIRFMRYLPPKKFLSLLNKSKCLVGNSSAGIKECSYLGVPVVNIGSRQKNRLRGANVLDVQYHTSAIKDAITVQIAQGRFESSDIYFAKDTAKNIAETVATVPLYVQKKYHEKVSGDTQ